MRFRKKSGNQGEVQRAAAAESADTGTDGDAEAADADATETTATPGPDTPDDVGRQSGSAEPVDTADEEGAGKADASPSAAGSGPADAAAEGAVSAGTASEASESARTASGPAKRPSNRRLAVVAVAGAIVFAAFAGVAGWRWAALHGDSPAESNSAFVDQSKTVEVTDAARGIVEGVFTYDYTDLDAYQASLEKLLDTQMLDRYQETADQNVDIITQAKTTINATVADGDIGVEKIDGDKATALLIMSRSGNNNDEQQVSDAAPLRVAMVEDDGKWKADSIDLL